MAVNKHLKDITTDVPNKLGETVDVKLPNPDLANLKYITRWQFFGMVDFVDSDFKDNQTVTIKVTSENTKKKKRECEFMAHTKFVSIKTGEVEIYTYNIKCKQPAAEKTKVEDAQEKEDDKQKKLAEIKKKIQKDAKELGTKAIGTAVTKCIEIGESIILKALKDKLGLDVTQAQLDQILKKLQDEYKKLQERKKQNKAREDKLTKAEKEGKKVDEKEKLMVKQVKAKLEELDQELQKQLDEAQKAVTEQIDQMVKDAMNGILGMDLVKDATNILIQSKAVMDGSIQMGTMLAGIPTEGVGASQTGTAGPYPAITTSISPSLPQVIATAKRVQSQGQIMGPPITSLLQSAANLGLESVTDTISPFADKIALISSVPIP